MVHCVWHCLGNVYFRSWLLLLPIINIHFAYETNTTVHTFKCVLAFSQIFIGCRLGIERCRYYLLIILLTLRWSPSKMYHVGSVLSVLWVNKNASFNSIGKCQNETDNFLWNQCTDSMISDNVSHVSHLSFDVNFIFQKINEFEFKWSDNARDTQLVYYYISSCVLRKSCGLLHIRQTKSTTINKLKSIVLRSLFCWLENEINRLFL